MGGNWVRRFHEGSGRHEKVENYCYNVIYGARTSVKAYGLRYERERMTYTMYVCTRGDSCFKTRVKVKTR